MMYVSIHTPTKGVTLYAYQQYGNANSFNPHTHEGCDLVFPIMFLIGVSFNPHTHEGCDLNYVVVTRSRSSFNPHTHEGCDPVWVDVVITD